MKLETRSGHTINVTRFAPRQFPADKARVVLDTAFPAHGTGGSWTSLTPEEARRLAGLLLFQAAAAGPEPGSSSGTVDVVPIAGDAYEVRVRGHVLTVDQPLTAGGTDTAPTPVELFVAAVASCAAHYAGRFLHRHGVSREGLSVRARFRMADDRPPRVAALVVSVRVPAALSPQRLSALRAVVSHCTVTNTLARAPKVQLDVRRAADSDGVVREVEASR
ncbi:OsmC family protein [Streptomyces sp. CRN 30]|uniref:OsmC family protein n=1 Tax=Streptomyces sp. CRN 30 TaxID=3075613 RepID=UPI002A7FC550|nr:OsmC family protein [Streptomyces sp. CRN 30]